MPYHAFPDSAAQWNEVSCYLGVGAESQKGYLFTLAGDTVIDNIDYTLIGHSCSFADGGNLSYQLPGTIFGAIREDSSRKVWFRNFSNSISWCGCSNLIYQLPLDSDLILYDFGLQVGDSAPWLNEISKAVLKIDSVQLLNGQWRRRILFDTIDLSLWSNQSWTDGIGSSWGLFGPYFSYPFEGYCTLTCFNQTGTTLLNLVGDYYCPLFELSDCNSVYTSIKELDPAIQVNMYPNPVSDNLNVRIDGSLPDEIYFELRNILETKVMRTKILANKSFLFPTSEIGPSGIYSYFFISEGKILGSGKIVIN